MSVYYKFKSARDYDSIPIDGHFISVAYLKERIFESKHLGRGTDFDLMVSNAQTNEEYVDEATLIPKNTSVLVRRVPGRPRKPIVTQQEEPKTIEEHVEEVPQHNNSSLPVADSSAMKFPEESEWDEFGNDLYAIPDVLPAQSSNPVVNVIPTNNVDEESKLKALIDTPSLEWQRQGQENYGPGRGFGRGMGGRMIGGRGFGRAGSGLERKTPPQGYICHRCKVPGHFIQHCPTNGDPNFDIRRVKPPTGIPKSMLMQTPDGSYALPSGAVAVLKPNEAAFEKEIEGMPSTRPVTDLPPELRCPLCKEVMKDAVLTSKCCFSSFCDKCIREHIISKSMCVCGFTNILADDLLPNKTLRETISRIMESTTTSSAENEGSLLHIQDMESARPLPSKVPSPTLSATKEEVTLPPVEHTRMIMDSHLNGEKEAVAVTKSQDNAVKNAEVSERTPESISAKATSQESAPVPEEVTQEKLLPNEQGKKKKKKKTRPPGGASDMQWRGYPELGVDNFTGMPMPPAAYNQYIPGMPWGMDGYMAPFPAGPMPSMGYPQGPFDVPFGGVLPQDPFAAQSYMMPILPQRDLSELSFGGFNKNSAPPIMSREELEARKADQRKRDIERHSERARSRDREINRDMSCIAEKSSLKPKPKLMSQGAATMDRPGRGKSPIRSSSARDSARRATPPLPSRPSKRKSDPEEATVGDRKMKGSVFSRISFPDSGKDGSIKKKNKSSDPPNGLKEHHETIHRREERRQPTKSSSAGGGRRTSNAYEHESSEEEYHFKRRPSSSSSRLEQATEWEDDERPSRGSRERERARDHDHERLAKHR